MYQSKYSVGDAVLIASHQKLEQFKNEWKWHHPIEEHQIQNANKHASIKGIGFYHGGDVLYVLNEYKGTWHEQCLESEDKNT